MLRFFAQRPRSTRTRFQASPQRRLGVAFHMPLGSPGLGGSRHRASSRFTLAASLLLCLSACDADLSPCARTEAGSDGSPRVMLWVDCRDERAAQLTALRVTPMEPLSDAGPGEGGDAGEPSVNEGEDAWRIQSPIEDGTDYFYVEYAVAPRGWDTLVAPRPLVSGQRYEVEFLATDIGSLSFEFKAP